jgi:hypothetical protein
MRGVRVRLETVVGPIALLVALAGAGCSSDGPEPGSGLWSLKNFLVAPTESRAPGAHTPEEALRLLEWCWERRDVVRYAELPTEDFRFVPSPLDPAGNAYRDDHPWTREDELISAGHLFSGGKADQPAASSIRLDLDRNFLLLADPRPGKDPRWHKSIRTHVMLHVVAGGEVFFLAGSANFFFVRGDSALIPPELGDRGFRPDPGRWYLERWEDETASGSSEGLRALPSKEMTWGTLKLLYR